MFLISGRTFHGEQFYYEEGKKLLGKLKSNLIAVGIHAVFGLVVVRIAIIVITFVTTINSESNNFDEWLSFVGQVVNVSISFYIGSIIFVYLPAFLFLSLGTGLFKLPKPIDWKSGLRFWAFWAVQAPYLIALAFEYQKMPERLISLPPIVWLFNIPIVTIFTHLCITTVLWLLTNYLIKRNGVQHG